MTIVLSVIGLLGSLLLAWILKILIYRNHPPEMYHLVEIFGVSLPSAHSLYAAKYSGDMHIAIKT